MLLQLNPPIPLKTPKGEGQAVVLIDYGPDYDLLWVVLDNQTGECWTWSNCKVRAVENVTLNHHSDTLRPNGHSSNRDSNGTNHVAVPRSFAGRNNE